ncbi:MAG: 4-phosphoerythronate dehydrogenase [Planctomycetota bacterium]|jgi:erythronate-4-phosphate dehydrogenase
MIVKIVADANIPFVAKCFSSMGDVTAVSGREMTPSVVADADCLLVRSVTRVDSQLLAESSVRFVGTATIGLEHVDIDFLAKQNIGFASAPGSNANSVAEYVVAAMLKTANKHKFQLQDKSTGIVGVGNVGSKVEKKVKALGMKVYLNDPPLQRESGDAKYLPIEKLYDCDFITLHTPLSFEGVDKTFHLADESFFKSLKTGCVFLNTSRGGVVDSAALKGAIKSGKVKSAVLDVWEDEPNIDVELLQMVDIGTPHIAGYSLDGKVAGLIAIYKAACEYFGFDAEFDIGSFLPEPTEPQLEIETDAAGEQEVLRKTVEKIYNINEDDSRLRWILDRPTGKRGKFFDNLRREYPVRREFQNTRVVVKDKNNNLADKLKGIGFKVTGGEKQA